MFRINHVVLRSITVFGTAIVTTLLLIFSQVIGLPNIAAQPGPKRLFEFVRNTDLTPKQEKILRRLKKQDTATAVSTIRINEQAFDNSSLIIPYATGANNVLRFANASKQKVSGSGGYTWSGRNTADTAPAPYASFFGRDKNIVGNFVQGRYVYSVRPLGDGMHVLIKRDPKTAKPDHPKQFDKIQEKAMNNNLPEEKKNQKKKVIGKAPINIHVMVLYTKDVSENHVDVTLFIDGLIRITNQTYKDSGIRVALTRAHAAKVKYTESGDLVKDTDRLRGKNDGFMDPIHKLRDIHKADVVVLLVDRGNAAGYAADILSNKDSAFAVADDEYADWYYTFAHEIGHLLGARHDPAADPTAKPFAYGHGFLNAAKKWRTVMSYNSPNGDAQRIGLWSSPLRKHQGIAAGTAKHHDNSRVVRQTAAHIAGFR